jgi:hypothetical protein
MRRRIYFLVPSIELTRTIVDELLLARIEERHMHLVAREGTPMQDLPEADVRQRTDLVESAEHGIAVGGVTGAVAGLVAVTFPPAGLVLGGGLVAATTLAGAGFDNITLNAADAMAAADPPRQYEVIALTGSVPRVPDKLKRALAPGGRMFVIIGTLARPIMEAVLLVRVGEQQWMQESLFDTHIPPLINAPETEAFEF